MWVKRLIDLLLAAGRKAATVGNPLPAERIAYFRHAYETILAEGEAANPRAPPSGKRGSTKQSKATNKLIRLRNYADDV